MRRFVVLLAGLVFVGIAGFLVATDPAFLRLVAQRAAFVASVPDLGNGRTMFYAGGCASCHATPEQDDKLRLGGGLALHSPFGTFHAPNISPDPKAGIGGWTLEAFARAMREGVAPDGSHYYPAFPFTSYQRMTDRDISDLYGFLRTLSPVETGSRPHDVAFPFNIRRLLGGWKLLFVDGKPFAANPAKDAEWNRGAYLVEGPGHCAECHSPRNVLGGIVAANRFSGGPDPDGSKSKSSVPNITPHKDGIAGWSRGDMVEFLKTGETPGFYSAGGSMKAVILNTSKLPDADRAAMARYLTELPPVAGKKPSK
jgi:mono/diheme cytochrome c family protein